MERCDNLSVGIIVENAQHELLLIERAKFPWGFAAPAGHVDDHGSLEDTAGAELFEEVGLLVPVSGLEKVIDARRIDNTCRRPGGDHHVWTVFKAHDVTGEVTASQDETKGWGLYGPESLQALADKTRAPHHEDDRDVLEGVWLDFLVELNYIR